MKDIKIRNTILLILTAAIWGSAFVAQSVGMQYVGPFTFTCTRSFIGGIFLIPCIMILEKLGLSKKEETSKDKKSLLMGGVCCGTALFVASNLQQIGMLYTTPGKAGFITALYIVIVPIMGIFLKKKCTPMVWLGVFLAVIGFYRLSINDGFSLSYGDGLILACAVVFSVHILVIDHFSRFVDGVKMSCIQFLVCGVLSLVCMLIFEEPSITAICTAWAPILYAGVLSSGVAYTLQIVGQKGYNPTIAALLLSLESVFSVLAGWIVLHQSLSGRELSGCVMIFAAVIFAQLPSKK